MKINTLSDLKVAKGIIQLNYVFNYSYVDKVGFLLNRYNENWGGYRFDSFEAGLLLNKPKENIETIIINPNAIALLYPAILNLDTVLDTYLDELLELLGIISIKELLRIGWRNYFILEEIPDDCKFGKLDGFKNMRMNNVYYDLEKCDEVQGSIHMINKINEEKKVILFNTDLFISEEIKVQNIKMELEKIKAFYTDKDKLITRINTLIA